MIDKYFPAVSNAEDAKIILENCLDKDVVYRFLRPWLGYGLFVAPRKYLSDCQKFKFHLSYS